MNTQNDQELKTGELLVKEGLIHRDDIATALAIQEKRSVSVALEKSRYIGMILCDLNLLTPLDNYVALHKHNKLVTLSMALVQKGIVSLDQMQAMEARSLREDIPLISLLMKTDTLPMPVMQKILFELFHISLRSISDFIFNEEDRDMLVKLLDKNMSKENGIIPLVINDNTILFGMTAPENMLLIHKLNQAHPQYRFKTIFIPYSGFNWFHDIVYRADTKPVPHTGEVNKPDLSLLLRHKLVIVNPEDEQSAILTFYRHYETIRTLMGHSAKEDRADEFYRFIGQAHKNFKQTRGIGSTEFSFHKNGSDVSIIANPKNQE